MAIKNNYILEDTALTISNTDILAINPADHSVAYTQEYTPVGNQPLPLKINLTAQSQGATISTVGEGLGQRVQVIPDTGYTGAVSFIVSITNQAGETSNTAAYTITIVNASQSSKCARVQDDHYQRQANDLMLAQFCDSTDLTKLFRTKSINKDRLNSILKFIFENTDIDTANCFMLDVIGGLVGVSRVAPNSLRLIFFGFEDQPFIKGFGEAPWYDPDKSAYGNIKLNDEDYRTAIRARISQLHNSVTMPGVASAFSVLYNTKKVTLQNDGDASLTIWIRENIDPSKQLLIKALGFETIGAAIGYNVLIAEPGDVFGFDDMNMGFKGFNEGRWVDSLQIDL